MYGLAESFGRAGHGHKEIKFGTCIWYFRSNSIGSNDYRRHIPLDLMTKYLIYTNMWTYNPIAPTLTYSHFNQMGAVGLRSKKSGGSIPGLATWISEIGDLLLPSRDMAELPQKRRKSLIQLTNQPFNQIFVGVRRESKAI